MRKVICLYLFSIIGLFLYTFTQVDLGLALTRFPQLFSIQRVFQHLGYFNRSLSSILYLMIVFLIFCSYLFILHNVKNNKINRKTFWKLVIFTAVVLGLAYNAFSHDLFNYIFDAKIFTFYGKNPYLYKALDFPHDPMLSFMHWTHRTYPYGPLWLGVTIFLSYLGLNIFILNFLTFKAFSMISFIGSVYFIEKIGRNIASKNALFFAAFFAFNPLVIIESLVSAHLDIFMIFLSVISLYFLLQKKYIWTAVFLLLSVGTKYSTVFLLPIFLTVGVLQHMNLKVPWKTVFFSSIASLSFSVFASAQKSGNFQPWYLLTLLPFVSLTANNLYIYISAIIISLGGLLVYLPYLYYGNWNEPVQDLLSKLYIITGVLLGLIITYSLTVHLKLKHNNEKLQIKIKK